MSAILARRGFLRGLTTLPLIGGGVTLVGAPTAVAEPVTDALMDHYLGFLAREYREVLVELDQRRALGFVRDRVAKGLEVPDDYLAAREADMRERCGYLCPPALDGRGGLSGSAPPSSRAALVLAALGSDWREAGR